MRIWQLAFYMPLLVIFITFPLMSCFLIETSRNFHACNRYANGLIVDVAGKQYARAEFNDQDGNKRLCQFKAHAHHKLGHIIPIRYNRNHAFLNSNENMEDMAMILPILLGAFIVWLPVTSILVYHAWLWGDRIKSLYTKSY